MEYKKRSLSSVLDDEFFDIEKQPIRRRATSTSIDEQLEEYSDYIYNGTFSITNSVFCGFRNLICPCFRKKVAPNN